MLTDKMEFHFIEMPKFRKLEYKDMSNPLHRWLAFFDKTSSNELLEELKNMDTTIQKAFETLDYLMSDEETMRAYEQREMALFDRKWTENQKVIEIIKNLYKEGFVKQKISDITGVSLIDIEQIISNQ